MVVPDCSPLSEHVVSVPLRPEDVDAPVGLGLILAPDQAGGSGFVLLRQTMGALIFLGCLRDRDGLPLELYEVWVQNAGNLRASFGARLQRMTNELFDRAWQERWQARRQVNGVRIPRTGWEEADVPPLFVDRAKGTSARVREPGSGRVLVLCTDESALRAAGLPGYRDSLFRFLWNQDPSEPHFYSLVADPTPPHPNVNDAPAGLDPRTVFNPDGGRLLAGQGHRRAARVGVVDVVDHQLPPPAAVRDHAHAPAAVRDERLHGQFPLGSNSRTSTKWPATAAAAAISGLTRCVRPPTPCRPSKLRLLVLALRCCGRS